MKYKDIIVAPLVVGVFFCSISYAVLPLLSLRELTDGSDTIVIARVQNVIDTKRYLDVPENKIRLKIFEGELKICRLLKGNPSFRKITISYFPQMSEPVELSVDEKAIFFIKDVKNRHFVSNNTVLKIEDGMVVDIYMKDQENTQDVNVFVQKIEALLK